MDTPLSIQITGLPHESTVELRLSAADTEGATWTSQAKFLVSDDGVVDVTRDAPVSGSYSGVAPMGLFWSMKPSHAPPNDTDFVYPPGGFVATLDVLSGTHVVASTTLTRAARSVGVVVRNERPDGVGFYGEFYSPADPRPSGTAIVVLGGSEGGLATVGLAELLASHGFPTLALAYFGEPGLPAGVTDIPLEYFAAAAAWLGRQPGVHSGRVDMLGISRGSEAALLAASDFPDLIHAVVGAAPTSVVNPPEPGPRGSAWTRQGVPVPSIRAAEAGDPAPVDDPGAVIEVENIPGPLFLLCGTDDAAWPSCGYADAIEARRRAHGGAGSDVELRFVGAGHGVASLVPFISEASTTPTFRDDGAVEPGGDPIIDGAGRASAWQRLLAFLSST